MTRPVKPAEPTLADAAAPARAAAPSRANASGAYAAWTGSPWAVELAALIRLAAPLAISQLAQMAILTTDVIMLGRLGTRALASAAIGNTVYYFAWLVGNGPAAAVAPLIAQRIGANPGDRAGVRSTARMGLWAALLVSAPLLPVLLSTRAILTRLGQDPGLAEGAGRFVSMLCFGLPFALGFQVLRNFATSLGRPQAALWVMLAAIGYNACADYVLIFGHFGLPRLGLYGAGLATSSSAVFAFLVLFGFIQLTPALRAYRILRRAHRFHWVRLKDLVHLGAPIGVTMLFEAMLFNTMTLVMGRFGAAALAAHQIAINFASITFMAPLGVAMAATVRVGRFDGAGDRAGARRAGVTAMALAVAIVSVAGVGMALYGRDIAGLYVPGRSAGDLRVVTLAASFLAVAAAFQVFDALQVVGALSLRGLKDAHMPMALAGGSYWLAGAPMCLWLGIGLGLKGLGVWIGLAFGLAVAAIAMCVRFHLLTRPRRLAPRTFQAELAARD